MHDRLIKVLDVPESRCRTQLDRISISGDVNYYVLLIKNKSIINNNLKHYQHPFGERGKTNNETKNLEILTFITLYNLI